jgi:acyl-CoA hydrolase
MRAETAANLTDVALIEVTAILEDSRVVQSSSIGNNRTWIDCASRVILEVNWWQPSTPRSIQSSGPQKTGTSGDSAGTKPKAKVRIGATGFLLPWSRRTFG